MAYRPTEKTEARRKAQHQLLVDAALQIVAEGGFQSLTIASVSERAEVATGTVYKYFDAKAALCAEVFRIVTEKEVQQVLLAAFPDNAEQDDLLELVSGSTGSQAGSGEHTCTLRLRNALETFSRRALAGRKLAYALIAEPVDATVQQQRLKYRQAYAEIFQRLIEEGVISGEFSPQNACVSASAIVGALAETLLGSIAVSQEGLDRDARIEEILGFCLAAITR